MICGKRGVFLDPKNLRFPRNRGLFKAKVGEKGGCFFNMENTDGLHKLPTNGGTGISLRPKGPHVALSI